MMKNVGTVDRVVRIVLGLVLIAVALTGPKVVWGWVGVIPLATALMGWCPAYSIFGIKTCKSGG